MPAQALWLLIPAAALFVLMRPKKAAAQLEDPAAAAHQLATYLREGGKFGNKAFPSPEVAKTQRILQIADDGIVGPITRAAVRKYDITLPPRRGQSPKTPDGPQVAASTPEGQMTVTAGARRVGATEPEPAQVARTPRQQKGSVVAVVRLKLSGIEAMVSAERVEKELKKNVGGFGPKLAKCPGAPALKGSPSISVTRHSHGDYTATMRWAATWAGTGISQALKACIIQRAKSIPAISSRLGPGGLKISRS